MADQKKQPLPAGFPAFTAVQNEAKAFAVKWIETHSLKLDALPPPEFKIAMDAIMMAIVNAWADGYFRGAERTNRRIKTQ